MAAAVCHAARAGGRRGVGCARGHAGAHPARHARGRRARRRRPARDVRARRGHDRQLARAPRRGAARPARRPGRLARDGQVVRPAAAAPVGQPAARLALRRGGPGRRARPRARRGARRRARAADPRRARRGRGLGGRRTPGRTAPRRGSRPRSTTGAATTGSRRSRSRTGWSWSCASRGRLTVTTSVAAATGPVPLAFGWHPWLSLPGVPRAEWELGLPAREAIALDDRGLPTGERAEAAAERAPLGDRVLDDHARVAEDAVFALAGGGREIAVEWAGGYRYAQVFAPAELDVACLEPMMAPVAALSDGEELRVAAAGRASRARRSASASPDSDRGVRDDVAMGRPETTVGEADAPVVRVDVLETFVELLTRVEDDGSSDAFYSSLCEAVCRLTSMDRAVIFRYDEARRRVRAAGAYGLDLRSLRRLARDGRVGADRAPGARRGPGDRDGRRGGRARGARAVPRPARRLDARCRAAVGRRALERRDPRRPPPAPPAVGRRARPAVDAGQDLGAGRGRAPRDVPGREGAPAAGADRLRARGARGRDPAAVRRAAGRVERRAAAARGARARDGRAAGRAARPAPRAAAAARAARRGRRRRR